MMFEMHNIITEQVYTLIDFKQAYYHEEKLVADDTALNTVVLCSHDQRRGFQRKDTKK